MFKQKNDTKLGLKDHADAQAHQRRLAQLTRERDIARGETSAAQKELREQQLRLKLLERINEAEGVETPPWTRVKKPTGLLRATPGLLFSDQHYDEVVDPAQVEGLNAYSREIAVGRTKELLEHTILVARQYLSGVNYDGFFLTLAGDTFSGNIHEELIQTNEDVSFGSLMFWLNELSGFVGALTEEFGHLHVVGISGNHGRQTRKPRAKFYAKDNLDWLLYSMLAREFKNDSRITWNIPDSRDAETMLYSTRIRTTHGDEAKGGSGIAGKRTPLALLDHRKTRRVAQSGKDSYDVLMYGHWHEYDPGERLFGNGSLKGVDEYALGGEFGFEEPKQGFFLVTPEHGVSLKAPIFCKPKKEKW